MTRPGPYYLTIGDFNRDGKLDIISANNGNATVGVLLGTGTAPLARRPIIRWAAGHLRQRGRYQRR